jgi:hypothetical protein
VLQTREATYPAQRLNAIVIDLHVFVTGEHYLAETLLELAQQWPIQMHALDLKDPTELALAARDFLIEAAPPANLSLYLEDDLVIHDPLYCDKQIWFLTTTNHQAVWMPHRYELTGRAEPSRLFVDGPLRRETIQCLDGPQAEAFQARTWDGNDLRFEPAANPHSGTFAISGVQQQCLRSKPLPRDGFIGPLETAATYTVLQHFPVFKTTWEQRDALCIEHGHPVFRYLLEQLPHGNG